MSTLQYRDVPTGSRATFSLPSILSIVAAIGSFFVGAGFAIFLSIAAAVLGVVGFAIALLPGVRGGMISILSMLLGAIGFVVALVRLIV